MACEDDKKRKCFTFIWKLEHPDYWWREEFFGSPVFAVEELDGTTWRLAICFDTKYEYHKSLLCLVRQKDNKNIGTVEIDFELSFLSHDGEVLHLYERKKLEFDENFTPGSEAIPSQNEMFIERRSEFLSQNALTVRCRIWKSVGEFSKDFQWFARSRLNIEKISFPWVIENFSSLKSNDEKRTHQIKSHDDDKQLMTLELFLSGGFFSYATIHLKTIPNYQNIKPSTLQVSIVDAFKNNVKCVSFDIDNRDLYKNKEFVLPYTKRELMEKKSLFLPNDVLSLLFDFSYCCGGSIEEIENASCDNFAAEIIQQDVPFLDSRLSLPKDILINDLKSMLNNSWLSDVKLKTRSKTFPAHKFILGIRSPVFQAMFSHDMKEKNSNCVDIEDLSEDTVLLMLRYLYSAEVDELEWGKAIKLYEAADKYQIVNLKNICSTYLKNNLCLSNACEALVLADLHLDKDLKSLVQVFILKYSKDIMNSGEWKQLMESNLKLAAETMYLKFKE